MGWAEDFSLPFGASPAAAGGDIALVYVGTKLFTPPVAYPVGTFTVPDGTSHVFVRAWGSAGSPDTYRNDYFGGNSGGGGYAAGLIPVFAGETLNIGVGTYGDGAGGGPNNGASFFYGGNSAGGGFTGVFRANAQIPLLIAGGGGGGQVNGTEAGGAGGGLVGQNSSGNSGAGGSQSTGGSFYSAAPAGGSGGGGGYWGGTSGSNVGGGGSSFIGSPGLIFGETISGNRMAAGGTAAAQEYPGNGVAAGDLGSNDNRATTAGRGYLILHVFKPAIARTVLAPAIPTARVLL